ncbi:MAG: PepSY-like domain-containing protein [Ferruginibacter sp.]
MKIQITTFMIALVALSVIGCNNPDKENVTTSTTNTTSLATNDTAVITPIKDVAAQARTEGNRTVVVYNDVPDTIRTSFTTKYPKIKKAEWYRYQPAVDDEMKMDEDYYYVRFNNNGTDYTSWFDNRGDWVKTSTIVPGNKNLPNAVNRYINVNYPGYTIEEISKENDKNMDMYEVKLNRGDSKVKLKILPNGKVFKRKTN